MTELLKLTGIVGSLRADSFNRTIFESASSLVGPGVELTEVPVRDVPFYNGDVEAVGDPEPVVAMKKAVAESDGLIVFTPEYNKSVPAVTKNAIDWLSSSSGGSVLAYAAVGIVAATPGRHAASGVRSHLGISIGSNTDRFFENSLGISSIRHKVTEGVLVDEEATSELALWLSDFISFVRNRN